MRTNGLRRRAMGALFAIAGLAATGTAGAQVPVVDTTLTVDGNLFYDNTADFSGDSGGAGCPGGIYTTTQFATAKFHNVTGVNPLLNAQVYTLGNPRWDVASTSPALASNGADVLKASNMDPWFADVCWLGAVGVTGGNDALDWTAGWTYYNMSGGLGRTDIDTTKAVATPGSITSDTTWTNNTNIVLNGRIGVNPPYTLTIEPGTVVMGTGVGSYLVVERGAKIDAQGTRQRPIIMTSSARWQEGRQAPGDWGGLVIHGRAWSNCAAAQGCALTNVGDCVSEGGAGNHGGTNDNDDSGILRYVRVEYSGFTISLNNELNSLTMNSVGRNTTIEHCQAVLGTDDLFEWFGGAARCRWLVAAYGADDNLDWQMGYHGLVQFAVCISAGTGLTPGADAGIEADNNEFNFECPLQSAPKMSNLTLVGSGPRAGATRGLRLRRGTGGKVINSIVTGWKTQGLRLEDAATFANCAGDSVASLACNVLAVGDLPVREARLIVRAAPNPTAGPTTLSFHLEQDENVRIQVFTVAGRLVETVQDGALPAGDHRLIWTPRGTAPGLYFYSVVTESGDTSQGKLVVTR